jgi:hypothetical protein
MKTKLQPADKQNKIFIAFKVHWNYLRTQTTGLGGTITDGTCQQSYGKRKFPKLLTLGRILVCYPDKKMTGHGLKGRYYIPTWGTIFLRYKNGTKL